MKSNESKTDQAKFLYETIAQDKIKYHEQTHCILLLKIMLDPNKGTYSAFCAEAKISEKKFQYWIKTHPTFSECYSIGKMYAKENWEAEGRALRDEVIYPGTSNYKMEYWKTTGWYRFGIGRNGKIKLILDPNGKPDDHYRDIVKQASEGEFTASEIKQLMEAINVGLNMHEKIAMQKEIDELKANLAVMETNSNVHNTFSNKNVEKKD